MALISIAGVSKRFGAFQALRDINLDIEARQFVTFLGPSGCGKTTLLRLLAGFLAPDHGTIRVADRVLSDPAAVVPPEERRMGMVFQNYAIWPHMTVAENVAFGLRIARIPAPDIALRVARMLDAVGLAGLGGRHPGQLSGGQQQRVALARSLVVEPDILLLDEPLSNLDAKLREHMRGELKSLQRRSGITFIYVTHDQAEAMALSDRIVVFDRGVVQQAGTPREVYERPANLFVADFMGLVNKLQGTLSVGVDGPMVRLGGQTLAVTLAAPAMDGTVTVAIRPEAIRFGPGTAGDNTLNGTVVEAVFLGNLIDYQIDVGGKLLRVQGTRWDSHPPGATVTISVAISECVALTPKSDRTNP